MARGFGVFYLTLIDVSDVISFSYDSSSDKTRLTFSIQGFETLINSVPLKILI